MTKKIFLAWRLPKLPTGSDVAYLVEQKVISAKEAREILLEERAAPASPTYTTYSGTSTVSFISPQKTSEKNS